MAGSVLPRTLTVDVTALDASDVLTTNELAALLKVHPVTVRLGAAAGNIPGRQVGNRWRFSRAVIFAWLAESK